MDGYKFVKADKIMPVKILVFSKELAGPIRSKNRVEINSRGMEWRKCPNKSGLVILLEQEKKMAIQILDENMTGLRTREKNMLACYISSKACQDLNEL